MTLKSIMAVFAQLQAPKNDETKQFNEFEILSHSQLESKQFAPRKKLSAVDVDADAGGFVGYVERL